jgi:hypothetical protein
MISFLIGAGGYGPVLSLPLWWGRLIVKRRSDTLFSERYGHVPTITLGPVRVTWRKYRAL